jgi:hypothetical protein
MGDSNTINALLMTGLLCAGFLYFGFFERVYIERVYRKGNYFFPDTLAPVVQCSGKNPVSRNKQITGFWSRQVPHFPKRETENPRDIMGHI